jgi:hypothetical protein
MLCEFREPTLREALSDPIIRAVMKADGVNPDRLEADLKQLARRIGDGATVRRRSAVDI